MKGQHRVRRRLVGILVVLIIAGCGIYDRYTYSTPTVDPGADAFVKNATVVLKDIELWLQSINSVGWAFLVPIPLPIPPMEREAPFLLTIQLAPKKPGFSFDPEQMFIVDNSGRKIQPARIKTGAYLKGHGRYRSVVGRIPASDLKAFIATADIKTQLTLEFDIKPPDPNETWFLDIEGLFLNDEKYPVPRIRFEPAFYSGPSR